MSSVLHVTTVCNVHKFIDIALSQHGSTSAKSKIVRLWICLEAMQHSGMFLTHEMTGVALDRALEQCLLGLQVLQLLGPGHACHRPYEVELEQEA